MFFAGVSYHFVTFSMLMCLFLGGCAYKISMDDLRDFFSKSTKKTQSDVNFTTEYHSQNEISIDFFDALITFEGEKQKIHITYTNFEPIFYRSLPYLNQFYNNLSLRAPPVLHI